MFLDVVVLVRRSLSGDTDFARSGGECETRVGERVRWETGKILTGVPRFRRGT